MSVANVTKIEYLGVRNMKGIQSSTIPDMQELDKCFIFLVHETDPQIVQSQKERVIELNALGELYIVSTLSEYVKHPVRKILVMDLSSYPYVCVKVDRRNQEELLSDLPDKFSRDVINAWKTPSNIYGTNIATIVVNLSIPYTGLKVIKSGSML